MSLTRNWVSPRTTFVRWLVGLAPWLLVVAFLTAADLRDAHDDVVELLRDGGRAAATVVSIDEGETPTGDVEVDVEYTHDVVGPVVAPADPGHADIGDTFGIAYDRDDPYRLVLDTAEPPDAATDLVVGVSLLVAAVTIGALQWTAWRMRRLAAEESPAFRMVGVVHYSRWSVVPRLSLFPLDSRAGDRAICTVRLAGIRPTRKRQIYEEVEVKGVPRPGGRVVARRGDTILWPRGRALLVARHARPSGRPHRPPPWSSPPATGPWPPPIVAMPAMYAERDPLTPLRVTAVAAGVGLLLTILVTALTISGGRSTDRWIASGRDAIATIADRADGDFDVAVDVVLADQPGTSLAMYAPAAFPEDYETGRRYPAVVSTDTTRVRLRTEPYDRATPILWAAVPTLLLSWHATRRALGG